MMAQCGLTVEITDDVNEYDSLEELKSFRGETANYLTLEGRKKGFYPYLQVEIRSKRISVCGSIDIELEALAGRLLKYIDGRSTWLTRWASVSNAQFFVGLMMMAIICAIASAAHVQDAQVINLIVLPPLILIVSSLVGTICGMFHVPIIFEHRHKNQNFWKRNKDKIILGVIGGIAGAILSRLVSALS
ncbi:MAG: hypothetical protein JWN94_1022 [Betaproteobacteria bacterium]|nr:hypothetical protein [Betaproteobacteria bacterium]